MKNIIWLLILLPLKVQAACSTDQVQFVRRTGFGISFGSGGSSSQFGEGMTVNVPLSIDGKNACFRKSSNVAVNAETSTDLRSFELAISPLKVEFENIPNAHMKQYLFIEKNEAVPALSKIHQMSFICSGDIPLSIEAFSDTSYAIALKSGQKEVRTRQVFATGQAAENLRRGQNGVSANQVTFDFFSSMYKKQTDRDIADAPKCEFNIPPIFSETSIDVLSDVHRKIATSYTTLGAKVVNGCTKDFAESMKNYQLQNYQDNDSISDFKVKKKMNGTLIISTK